VVCGHNLYLACENQIFCLDLVDQILATQQAPPWKQIFTGEAVQSDLCYQGRHFAVALGGNQPEVGCWKADASGARETWRHPLVDGQASWWGLVFCSDALLVAHQSGLLELFDIRTGEIRSTQVLRQTLAPICPLVREDIVLAVSEASTVLAIEPRRNLAFRCVAEPDELPVHGLGAVRQTFCLCQGRHLRWGDLAGGHCVAITMPQDHFLSDPLLLGTSTLAVSREGSLFHFEMRGRDVRTAASQKLFGGEGLSVSLRATRDTVFVTGDWGEVVAVEIETHVL